MRNGFQHVPTPQKSYVNLSTYALVPPVLAALVIEDETMQVAVSPRLE